MEGRRHRREVGEGRGALETPDVAEGAAVAHSGQQHAPGIDAPAAAHGFQDAHQVRRIGVVAHQRPGVAGRGRCDQDRAAAAGVAQPAPQEAAAVAAAAVQRHHQRHGAVGRVIFRHVEREAAAAAGLVVIVEDAGVFVGRRPPAAPRGRRRRAARGRRRSCSPAAILHRQRIQRLLRAGHVAQRAEHGDEIAIAALLDLAQGRQTRRAPRRRRDRAGRAARQICSGHSPSAARAVCSASSGAPIALITRSRNPAD